MTSNYEGLVVLGAPRSGTTLLRRLLDAHPDITCPPETNLLSAASRFLEEAHFSGGLSVGVIPGLSFSDISEEEVFDRFREFLFGFWRTILEKSGKKIWAEKTAVDVFHIDAIERLCGDRCRYICISRHALDVVCSMKDLANKMDAYLPELHDYSKQYLSMSEAAAHAWSDANQSMLDFVERHPDWCIQLKYEDLVENTDAEMNRIFCSLGIDEGKVGFADNALQKKASVGLGDWKTYNTTVVSTKQVGRHDGLDSWTLQRIASTVNSVLVQLGYEAVNVQAHNFQEDDRRAQELGRMVAAMNLLTSGSSTPDA